MTQLCPYLLALITGLGVYVPRGLSWLVDNVPFVAKVWEKMAAWLKVVAVAAVSAVIGGVAAYVGLDVLHCADWPDTFQIIYAILIAVAGYFNAGKRHEAQRRDKAEQAAHSLAQTCVDLAGWTENPPPKA